MSDSQEVLAVLADMLDEVQRIRTCVESFDNSFQQFGPADLKTSLSASEAAELLGCSARHFNRLVRLGDIRPIPGKARRRRYDRADIERYKQHGRKPL